MSDYTRVHNFTAKDALPTGNANKKILGSQVDADFDAAATAIATKLDKSGGAITGNTTIAGTLGTTGIVTIDSADDAALVLDKAASGDAAYIQGKTGGSLRWSMSFGNSVAEASTANGSNFTISTYDNTATLIGTPLQIVRSDMSAVFAGAVTGVSFTATSDRRLKTDLQRIEGALDKVDALTGYTFNRIDLPGRQTGLIAQDVQAVLPEAVTDNNGTLGLAYGNLAGLLVEAIKELRAEVNAIKLMLSEA